MSARNKRRRGRGITMNRERTASLPTNGSMTSPETKSQTESSSPFTTVFSSVINVNHQQLASGAPNHPTLNDLNATSAQNYNTSDINGNMGPTRSSSGTNNNNNNNNDTSNAFPQTNSQLYRTPSHPNLPPGKNDLEILENLKEIIKNGQHERYRPIPQPAALASVYLGRRNSQSPHPEQAPDHSANGYRDTQFKAQHEKCSGSAPASNDINKRPTIDTRSSRDTYQKASPDSSTGRQPTTPTLPPRHVNNAKKSFDSEVPSTPTKLPNERPSAKAPRSEPPTPLTPTFGIPFSKFPESRTPGNEGPRSQTAQSPTVPAREQGPQDVNRLTSPPPAKAKTTSWVDDRRTLYSSWATPDPGHRDNKKPSDNPRDRVNTEKQTNLSERSLTERAMPPPSSAPPPSSPRSEGNRPSQNGRTTSIRGGARDNDRDYRNERGRTYERDRDLTARRDLRSYYDHRDLRPQSEFIPRPPPEQRHYEPNYKESYLPRRLDRLDRKPSRDDLMDVDRQSLVPPPKPSASDLTTTRSIGSDDKRPGAGVGGNTAYPQDSRRQHSVSNPKPEDRHARRSPSLDHRSRVEDQASRHPAPSVVHPSPRTLPREDHSRPPVPIAEERNRPRSQSLASPEERTKPSLQDRIQTAPGPKPELTNTNSSNPNAVNKLTHQRSLEERLLVGHLPTGNASESRSAAPSSVPTERPPVSAPQDRDKGRPSPHSNEQDRYARSNTPVPSDYLVPDRFKGAADRRPVERGDARAKSPAGPAGRTHTLPPSAVREYRSSAPISGRQLSRERQDLASKNGLIRGHYDDDRRPSDAMDVDSGSRYPDARITLDRMRSLKQVEADRERERERATGRPVYSPPSPRARSRHPLDAPYEPEPERRYSHNDRRDWSFPSSEDSYDQRRRDWNAPDAEPFSSWKVRQSWDRDHAPPPRLDRVSPAPLSSRGSAGSVWDPREERERRTGGYPSTHARSRPVSPERPPPFEGDSSAGRSLSSRLSDYLAAGSVSLVDDRGRERDRDRDRDRGAYLPPPPSAASERTRYPPVGPASLESPAPPQYGRTRARSPSPPRRGGIDDLGGPPLKRPREEGSFGYYSPPRRGSGLGDYPPRSGSGGGSAYYDSRSSGGASGPPVSSGPGGSGPGSGVSGEPSDRGYSGRERGGEEYRGRYQASYQRGSTRGGYAGRFGDDRRFSMGPPPRTA